MAKKDFSFDDINSELKQLNPMGSIMADSTFSEVTEWIDTGNYHLNACVSGSLFGGWPNSRTCSIAGPSGTGKTFLVLNSVRKAIEMGYNVIYFDSEAAVDKDQMEKFGIDVTKVNYQPINTVQEFRTSVTTLTSKMQEVKRNGGKTPKIMMILDSAGNLATQKEIDDAQLSYSAVNWFASPRRLAVQISDLAYQQADTVVENAVQQSAQLLLKMDSPRKPLWVGLVAMVLMLPMLSV